MFQIHEHKRNVKYECTVELARDALIETNWDSIAALRYIHGNNKRVNELKEEHEINLSAVTLESNVSALVLVEMYKLTFDEALHHVLLHLPNESLKAKTKDYKKITNLGSVKEYDDNASKYYVTQRYYCSKAGYHFLN